MTRLLGVVLACAILAAPEGRGGEPASSAVPTPGAERFAGQEVSPTPQAGADDPQVASPDVLEGRLLVGGVPADTGTVVLHGVNPEEAGPLDSMRVDSEGRFRFDLTATPPMGGGQSLFASHRREGVLYFGPPLFRPEEIPEEYVIRAFTTREAPASGLVLEVEIRNIVVEEGPGVWRVTDIIQVHNDSSVTWVSADGESPVWRYPLPPEAGSFRVMEGGAGPGDVRFEDATLLVSGAFPPGDRLFVIQYDLPSLETSIPLTGPTDGIEFLVRDPAPPLIVDGLRADAPVEMERGSVYMRWWGEDVGDRVVRVRIGEESELPTAWLAVGVALLLALLGAVLVKRSGGRTRPVAVPGVAGATGAGRPDPARRRREILLAIARLDEEGEAAEGMDAEARRRRRAVLLGELARIEDSGEASGDP